jgi:hypothetical protein
VSKPVFVEHGGRVYRVTLRRGRRNPNRVRFTVEVESGPSLTGAESRALLARWVSELLSAGYDVRRWAAIPEAPA